MTQMQDPETGTQPTQASQHHDAGAHGQGGDAHAHDHAPHLAHHFDTPTQQFESGKLGMWVFLATEILMFGGLFAAYGMYRGNHPEIYLYAHHYLDTTLGAINTIILLASSFTVAWGVRAAQKGQRKLLVTLLLLTLLGGFGFMGIKAIEYTSKFTHDLWPGSANMFYNPTLNPMFADANDPRAAQLEAIRHLEEYYGIRGGHGGGGHGGGHAGAIEQPRITLTDDADPGDAEAASGQGEAPGPSPAVERSMINPPAVGAGGLSEEALGEAPSHVAPHMPAAAAGATLTYEDLPPTEQSRAHMFFQIYYMMTGLHAVHVLVGLGLISWITVRSFRGAFGPAYYTPVDLVGLYWHLVDLIWIFLFPLLYLIH